MQKQKSASCNKGLLKTLPFVTRMTETPKRGLMYLKWEAQPHQHARWTIVQPAACPALKSLLCQLRETNTIDYKRNNEQREDVAASWNRKLQDKMCAFLFFLSMGKQRGQGINEFLHPCLTAVSVQLYCGYNDTGVS